MLIAQTMMQIGCAAVDHFMATGGYANETRIGETDLTRFIAEQMKARGWGDARAEHYYDRLAIDRCGLLPGDDELVRRFGLCRADVTTTPLSTVNRIACAEFKIVDEGRPWLAIKEDYDQIRDFQALLRARGSLVTIDGYVGGLICDINKRPSYPKAKETCAKLCWELGDVEFVVSKEIKAVGAEWWWCFVCGKMADLN